MLFDSILHRSSSLGDVDFTALTVNPVNYTPSCLVGSTVSFGRARSDLYVVSDLKTVRMPCCCRQRQSCSDRPLT